MVNVLVTGGAGFIGSNFVRYAIATHADWRVTTLDKLTYAGRLENLRSVIDNPRHAFVKGDVADAAVAAPLVRPSDIVVHFAAETHVDRSIAQRRRVHHHRRLWHVRAARSGAAGAERCGASCRFPPTRSTAACRRASSRETDELRPRNPTRRARPAPTAWPTATGRLTRCRSSSPAPRTTTVRTSSPRRSSRSSSPTPSTTCRCRCTATA